MCTAVSFCTSSHYFGRNLDLEFHYNECVTVTPRNYPFIFRDTKTVRNHFAMIGMATIADGYPLYYDATNEHGLSAAGLNFPDHAVYFPATEGCENVASFELIPWVLSQCKTVQEAKMLLKNANITNKPFSKEYPPSPLHWILSDADCSVTVESVSDGLQVVDNPVGILTNSPPFAYHMYNLSNYMNLTSREPNNRFSDNLLLQKYSRGMGAIGLPGDLSSASRFIRASFIKENSVCANEECASVSQFFHILDAVAQQRGCVRLDDKYEITVYSSCCNTNSGVYYYKTYDNSQLTAVNMFHADIDGTKLDCYPLRCSGNIFWEN